MSGTNALRRQGKHHWKEHPYDSKTKRRLQAVDSQVSLITSGFCTFVGELFEAATPQKFGVDFRQFSQSALKFQMRGIARAGLSSLFRRFEQKLPHPAGSQALHQIIERAVLESALAAAIPFPASQVLADIRSAQQMGRDVKPGQQNRSLLP